MKAKPSKSLFRKLIRWFIRSRKLLIGNSGMGSPSLYHALIVIFLEFFAWGLLTMPSIKILNETFPDHTFLMNGLIMGIKGILSFLSAPLIGALSDVMGRKIFLLITVFFTCLPIPLMALDTFWFFASISISGLFAVTFSVVFAYVADVTDEKERSLAYGLVSGTFAASLVVSPALGSYLMENWSVNLVTTLATSVAILDVFFILVAVPESLPEKVRTQPITWQNADPFLSLRNVGDDPTILLLCVAVFLSYLPEAGQYSCIFVYLNLVIGWNASTVSVFVGLIGLLAVVVQLGLGTLMKSLGSKRTIMLGLLLESLQLLGYGIGTSSWMMWFSGILASLSSISYPAISSFVSLSSDRDKQGSVQGIVTGIRGLCNGIGPALFGIVFYLFDVDLNGRKNPEGTMGEAGESGSQQFVPGPPFILGSILVMCALAVASYIPEDDRPETGSKFPNTYSFSNTTSGSFSGFSNSTSGNATGSGNRSMKKNGSTTSSKCRKPEEGGDVLREEEEKPEEEMEERDSLLRFCETTTLDGATSI